MKPDRLLTRLREGSVHNVGFKDLMILAETLGFELVRVRGSHHIYRHPDLDELINLQNVSGKAKAYQARQLLKLVDRYNLRARSK